MDFKLTSRHAVGGLASCTSTANYCGLEGSPWPALGAGTGVGGGEFGDAGAGDAVGEFVGGAADDLCGPVVMALSGLSR